MSILLSYQKKFVNFKERFQIYVKSRQIGFSFAYAYESLRDTLLTGKPELIVSASQRQSNIVISHVEKFIQAFQKLPSCKGLKLTKDTQTEKIFNTGGHIISLPANPNNIRGFAGNVKLDEFALYDFDNECYKAMLPSITRGFKVKIISTPLGQSNLFYRIWTDHDTYKNYLRNSITIYEAIAQGLKVDIDEIKNNIDEESFRQEYLCEFIDESTSYFTYDLLKRCQEIIPVNLKGKTYIGIDIGRSHDLTAIAVIVEMNNIFYLKRLETLRKTEFSKQFDTISQIIYEENPQKVLIDKGVIGMQLAEDLGKKYFQCEGVQFNPNYISEIVTNGKKLMETNRFKFVDNYDVRQIISEFHSIQKNVTAQNNVSFRAERTAAGHSDRAFATLLGLQATKNITSYQIFSVDL